MTELSNSLADLAERVKQAAEASALAERTTIEKAIEAGELLCQANDEAKHGEWLPFLARAGVPERKAQRFMQLARSGLKSDTCRDLGGIKGALAFIAKRKAAVEMLSSLAEVHEPETAHGGDHSSSQTLRTETEAERFTVNSAGDAVSMVAFHTGRASRLRKTMDLVGEMYEMFTEEAKSSAELWESRAASDPLGAVVAEIWSEIDAYLVSENLSTAYAKLQAAMLHCARSPSEEAYLIVTKASGIVRGMIDADHDVEALLKISNDDKTSALAAHVDAAAKAGGWLQ